MGVLEETGTRVEPCALDLPGPSRRIKVEPLRLPEPQREPPPAEPAPPPREPAEQPEREPARR
jgi:hypothetical protein